MWISNPQGYNFTCVLTVRLRNDGSGPADKITMRARVTSVAPSHDTMRPAMQGPDGLRAQRSALYSGDITMAVEAPLTVSAEAYIDGRFVAGKTVGQLGGSSAPLVCPISKG